MTSVFNNQNSVKPDSQNTSNHKDRYLLNPTETAFIKLNKVLVKAIKAFIKDGLLICVDYRLEFRLASDLIDPIPKEFLDFCELHNLQDIARSMGFASYLDLEFARYFWLVISRIGKRHQVFVYSNLDKNVDYVPAYVVNINKQQEELDKKELVPRVYDSVKKCIIRYIFNLDPSMLNDNPRLRAEFSKMKLGLKQNIYWHTLLQDFPQLSPGFSGDVLISNEELLKIIADVFSKLPKYYTSSDKAYIDSLIGNQEQ